MDTPTLFIFLLLNIGLISCNPTQEKAQKIQDDFWENTIDENWRDVYQITQRSDGRLSGALHRIYYGSKHLTLALDEITYTEDTLGFRIEKEGLLFQGQIDLEKNIVEGQLVFPFGNEPTILKRIKASDVPGLYAINEKAASGKKYRYTPPDPMNDGIKVSNLSQESINEQKVDSLILKILNNEVGEVHALLVAKNGKLVLEEYFYDYNAGSLHPLHSTTKSVFSLLIGLATDHRWLPSMHEKVYDLYPNITTDPSEKASRMTLEHLITLTSGFDQNHEPEDDCQGVECLLHRPVIYEPGEKFQYTTDGPEILGDLFKRQTGIYVDEFAEETLFSSLGIEDYLWIKDVKGSPITSGEQGGLFLRPRDLLKIGLMVQANGIWNGRQVVSEEWVQKSTARQVDETNLGTEGYGYYWWIQKGGIFNHKEAMIFAQGSGFQVLIILPEKNMTIVVTAGNHFETEKNFELWKAVTNLFN